MEEQPRRHTFFHLLLHGWLLISLILHSSLLAAENFRQLGLSDGLSQPSVMAIHQDRLGRMWFGTREGINRYDGLTLTAFKGWYAGSTPDAPLWLGNHVSDIAEDREGNLFFLIDQDIVRFDLQTEQFHRLTEGAQIPVLTAYDGTIWFCRHDSLFTLSGTPSQETFVLRTSLASPPTELMVTSDHIALGTHYSGFYLYDRTTHRSTHWLDRKEIYAIFQSSTQEYWISTRMEGLYRMPAGAVPQAVPYLPHSPQGTSSLQIRTFVEDNLHRIWFGTFNGLQQYDPRTDTYSLIQVPSYAGGLAHPSIFSLYKDRQGIIWVGSYFGGVNYFQPEKEGILHYDYDINAQKGLYYSYITDLVTDHQGRLWFGTDGGGVVCTDAAWNIVHQLTAGKGRALPHNNIKTLDYDALHHSLYIGTYLGGLCRYDLDTQQFTNYLYQPHRPEEERPGEVIFHVQMWQDDLYLSSRNGVFRLDTQTQRFHKLPALEGFCLSFDINPQGILYLGYSQKMVCVDLNQPDSIQTLLSPAEIRTAQLTHILATPEGAYATTLGAGVFFVDRATQTLQHYTADRQQLASDYCYNLCRSRNGSLFVISDQGISRITSPWQCTNHLNLKNEFPTSHLIQECGMYASPDGKVYIGTTKGVAVLSEDYLNKPTFQSQLPPPFLSQLWVNNQPITAGDPSGILTHALPFTPALELNHTQNNLVLEWALPDYTQHPSSQQFLYKLEGMDQEWMTTHQTKAHYTNLTPGDYVFQLVTTLPGEADSPTLQHPVCLKIHIATPWYNTWWAWMLYLSTAIGWLYHFLRSRWAKRTLALSLEKERFEKQQIEKLNQEKLVFFTNVSHEFRTPLTLIISHVDILLQKNTLAPSLYNSLMKVKKNAQKMNSLISELLEFRKLEQNHEILQLKQQDMTPFLREIYLSFSDYAQQRAIRYTFQFPEAPLLAWFDKRLMEDVFFNLLSNAFKYTPDKGSIHLQGSRTEDGIVLQITDSGIGIAEQDTLKIFQRFYQSDRKSSIFSSTGIGLALTKTIVEKHHGHLSVKSSLGQGSTFTVLLPDQQESFAEDPHIQLECPSEPTAIVPGSWSLPTTENPEEEEETSPVALSKENAAVSHTLLLVEDNEELLQVLTELFSPFYRILTARNGKEGLRQVQEHRPDLVISDILMPEMSGTEMCIQIKNNLDLCHIPVILLTALSSPEQNIDGLNRGADDYITKPFHAQLLLARANNLLRSRLLIQHQFDKKPIDEIDLTSINPLDKDLLKRASQIIEKQLDNPDFDIPTLCKELGIGRTLLFSKFKALTGMTPNNYILNFRLKSAATLLQRYPDLPIAEVSDRCGFNTPAYFSRCFKNQYGCSPLSYQKGNHGKAPEA